MRPTNRHIESLFALRKGAARNGVFEIFRIDARAFDKAFDNVCGEVVGPDLLDQTAFSGGSEMSDRTWHIRRSRCLSLQISFGKSLGIFI